MKKVFLILLSVIMIISFSSCGNSSNSTVKSGSIPEGVETLTQSFSPIMSSDQYITYGDVFNDSMKNAPNYVDKDYTATGTFAILEDNYNNMTRYYVWGYYDNTKCCDWQWEIVPKSKDNLPKPGSKVTVSGIFKGNDSALDKYWIEDATIKVEEKYNSKFSDCDVDMTVMSATLERVQIANIQSFADKYEGKSIAVYGRIMTENCVQHPYYDNSWSQDFISDTPISTIGICTIIKGEWKTNSSDGTTATGCINNAVQYVASSIY